MIRKNLLFFIILLIFLITACSIEEPGSQNPANRATGDYTLVWSDEFNGPFLDLNKWEYDIGTGPNNDGWGNWELQYYTDRQENVYIENGSLVLQAKRENHNGKAFTSGRITTRNRFSFRRGRIEARIKLPYGKGSFPAFWLLGNNFDGNNWPHTGEIDILELFGNGSANADRLVQATCFWYDPQGWAADYGQTYISSTPFYQNYHIFSITWDENYIRAYVDGNLYYTIAIGPQHDAAGIGVLRTNMYNLIINYAVGGIPTGCRTPGDVTAPMPQKMYIDWVRVYQDSTGTVIQHPAPTAIHIMQYDKNIEAGSTFNASINLQGANFTTHFLYVEIRNAERTIIGKKYETDPNGNISLTIPGNAQEGTYYLKIALISRSLGWNDPSPTFIQSAQDISINRQLAISRYDKTIQTGDTFTADINLNNVDFATHFLYVEIRNAERTIIGKKYETDPNGNIALTIPGDAQAGTYYFKMALISRTLGWNDPSPTFILSAQDISINRQLAISRYDKTIQTGDTFTSDINLNNVDFATHFLYVEIRNAERIIIGKKYETNPNGNIALTIPGDAQAGTYYFKMALISRTLGWNDPSPAFILTGQDISINRQLAISRYDKTIQAGAVFTADINLNNVDFTTHFLYVEIRNAEHNIISKQYNTDPNGNISLTIPGDAQAGTYYFKMALISRTLGWSDPSPAFILSEQDIIIQ